MQLTTNQALFTYGIGISTAVAGLYNYMFLAAGMFTLFTISVLMTIFGVD